MATVVSGCYGLEDCRPHHPILSPGVGVGGGPGQQHNTAGTVNVGVGGGVSSSNEKGGMGSGNGGASSGSFLGSLFGSKRSKAPGPIIPPGPPYPAPVPPPTTGGPPPLSPSSLCQSEGGGPSKIQALHAQYCHTGTGQPPPPYHHHHRYNVQTVPPPNQPSSAPAPTHQTLQRSSLPRRPPPAPSHTQLQQLSQLPQISQHALQGRYANMAMGMNCHPPLSPHSLHSPLPQYTLYHAQPTHSARGGGATGKPPLTLAHSHPHSHSNTHPGHVHTPHPNSLPAHPPHFVFAAPPQPPTASITARHLPQGAQYLPQSASAGWPTGGSGNRTYGHRHRGQLQVQTYQPNQHRGVKGVWGWGHRAQGGTPMSMARGTLVRADEGDRVMREQVQLSQGGTSGRKKRSFLRLCYFHLRFPHM
ncbi:IQ motif and SEC7 domain-containing protein 1-like [Arapaima gigas]